MRSVTLTVESKKSIGVFLMLPIAMSIGSAQVSGLEATFLEQGILGAIILGMAGAIIALWRQTQNLQIRISELQKREAEIHELYSGKYELLLEKSTTAQMKTNDSLEKVTEGLAVQSMITDVLGRLQRNDR